MLKDSLYTIKQISNENNIIEATVELDKTHAIFKGHFPSQPILPGACMLQMTKEILEALLHAGLQLLKASEIKFLQMIQPADAMVLLFSIEYNITEDSVVHIAAKITRDNAVCYKLKASYKIKPGNSN